MSARQRAATRAPASRPDQPVLLPEGSLWSVLRKVERGEISARGPHGVVRHREQRLPCELVAAFGILCRDRYVALGLPAAGDGSRVARLTVAGTSLLAAWCERGDGR